MKIKFSSSDVGIAWPNKESRPVRFLLTAPAAITHLKVEPVVAARGKSEFC